MITNNVCRSAKCTGLIDHSPEAPRIALAMLTSAAAIHHTSRSRSWANPPAMTHSGAIDATDAKSMKAWRVVVSRIASVPCIPSTSSCTAM